MEVKSDFKSQLKLNDIFVSKTEFSRNLNLTQDLRMSFNFKHEITNINESDFSMVLNGSVKSADNSLTSSVSVVAYFSFECDNKNAEMRETVRNNSSLAIMFPYLRAQFTLVSSQSGIPIILPPVNINAYFESNTKSET